MSAVILPPSGEPFEIVGTAEVRGREQAGRIDTLEDAAITRKEELEAAEEAYQVAMNDRFLPTQRERAEAAVERCAELMKLCGMAATTIERLADIVVGDHPGAGVCNHEREQATELRVKSQGRTESARFAALAPPARGDSLNGRRLDVVSAVIISETGYLLLAKRLPTAAFPDLYETPGGKREPGETLSEAIAREIKEELGVDCEVGAIFGATNADPPDVTRPLRITFFRVTLKGVPQALAAESLLWASREEVLSLPMLPGNSTLRAELAALCSPAPTGSPS